MITSRTPFRISLFGGGTDYPEWYRKHGGAVLATTIDKYCYNHVSLSAAVLRAPDMPGLVEDRVLPNLRRGRCVTFRFATLFVVSPRMRLDLRVKDFTYRAVTDRFIVLFEAHFKRNYQHVGDAARASLHALANSETMKGRPYKVRLSDANLSKWELCGTIRRHVPELYFVEAQVGQDPTSAITS